MTYSHSIHCVEIGTEWMGVWGQEHENIIPDNLHLKNGKPYHKNRMNPSKEHRAT